MQPRAPVRSVEKSVRNDVRGNGYHIALELHPAEKGGNDGQSGARGSSTFQSVEDFVRIGAKGTS